MFGDNLESLIHKLEKIIGTNLQLEEHRVNAINDRGKHNIFNKIEREFQLEIQRSKQGTNNYQKERDKLRESYYLLRTFVHYLPSSVAILDRELRYLAVSDRWIKDYELENTEIIGRTYDEVFPTAPQEDRRSYYDCLAGKIEPPCSEEKFWVHSDGRIDWLRWQLHPWHDSKGQIGGVLVFCEVNTEKKLLQQKIESTEKQMRAVFSGMNELVFTVELASNSILFLPTKFFDLYSEATVNQIIACIQNELFGNDKTTASRLIRRILRTKTAVNFEYSLQLDKSPIWFSVNVSAISEAAVIWIARDITERKEAEQDLLFAKNELAQVTLQSIGDAVITTDANGSIEYINPVAEQLTGWRNREAYGQSLSQVFQIVDEVTGRENVNLIERDFCLNRVCQLTSHNLIARDGEEYAIEGLASPLKNRQQESIGTAIVFRDVTSARNMARKISWQANHDSLTELFNRYKFEEYVSSTIAEVGDRASHHVLGTLDLDRFKIVNDTCGHPAGDKLLQQIANLLQKRIRDSDIFARVGGDEFGLLLRYCPIDVAQSVAEQLRQSIENFRFVWEGKVFRIGVSIGLVEIKPNVRNLTDLLAMADAACYVAKQRGGNCVHLYHEEDTVIARQQGQRQWIEKLNRALEENRFSLYTQKIVAIDEKAEVSQRCRYEVLLRLQDEAGAIAPDVFLPAAERYGLMPAIDRYVITTFLAGYELYCQTRQQQGLAPSSNIYSINLSGASINSSAFANFLEEQFACFKIPPATVCFEITETVAITNFDNAIALIERLKELGCSIALDDFGSGMSSLTYLKNLPIDYLKIDGSFVTNIAHDEIDYATLECFHHISQIMKIETVAEFVENSAILQRLQKIGIDYAQGYGIERPHPLVWT